MRVTKRDIKVILLLIGILSAFITYQFYLRTKLEDISKKEDEITKLQNEIAQLKIKKQNEFAYRKQMGEWDSEVTEKEAEFPQDQWYEDGFLFLNYMEKRHELYDEEEMKIYFHEYEVKEAEEIANITGNMSKVPRRIVLMDSTTDADFICDYASLKEMINVIYANKDTKRMIRNMNIEVKWTDKFPLKGDILFSSFALTDLENDKRDPYVPVPVPGYQKVYDVTHKPNGTLTGEEYVPETVVSTDPDTGETKVEIDDIIGIECVFGDLTPPTTTAEETSSEAYR